MHNGETAVNKEAIKQFAEKVYVDHGRRNGDWHGICRGENRAVPSHGWQGADGSGLCCRSFRSSITLCRRVAERNVERRLSSLRCGLTDIRIASGTFLSVDLRGDGSLRGRTVS